MRFLAYFNVALGIYLISQGAFAIGGANFIIGLIGHARATS